jgi:hypothetical protein
MRAIEGFVYRLYAAPIHPQSLPGGNAHVQIPGALLGSESRQSPSLIKANAAMRPERSMVHAITVTVRSMAERLDDSALVALSIALEEKVTNALCKQVVDQSPALGAR